jgi:HlyD family secretion protein
MRRWGCSITLIALVPCVALSAACGRHDDDEIETTGVVPVSVATVRRGTIRAVVTATAVVRPATGAELDIFPPAGARIVELPAAVGDRVAKGGLLVRFEAPSLAAEVGAREADVRSAQATLESAHQAFEREKHLVERGIAAEKELEAARRDSAGAEAALEASRSALQAAKQLAARATVRAPFTGIVTDRSHNIGDVVEASSEPILRFIDPSHLQAEAAVPVTALPRLKAGAAARVIGPEPLAPEFATVMAVPGAVDPQTAIAVMRLALGTSSSLPSGTPVRVEIVAEEKPGALIVPSAALVHDGADAFVYTVGEDDIAHRRKVTVGIVADPDTEILSGVEEHERVVTGGAVALPDGAKIAIRE